MQSESKTDRVLANKPPVSHMNLDADSARLLSYKNYQRAVLYKIVAMNSSLMTLLNELSWCRTYPEFQADIGEMISAVVALQRCSADTCNRVNKNIIN